MGPLLFRLFKPMLQLSRSDLVANRSAGTRKSELVVEEFESPIRLLHEGVQLERELRRIDRCAELLVGHRGGGLFLQTDQPTLRQLRNLISDRAGTAVELSRRRREKASAAKYDLLHVCEPAFQHREQTPGTPVVLKRRLNNSFQENLSGRIDSRKLKLPFGTKVREYSRFA